MLTELQQQAVARGLGDLEVKSYLCFGGCAHGPNLVVYPQKVWYAGVKPEDTNEILDAAASGSTVTRLTGRVDRETQELIYQLLDTGLF